MTPDNETIDWIFDSSRWWIESFGGFQGFAAGTSIVAPTERDFPVDMGLRDHALVGD